MRVLLLTCLLTCLLLTGVCCETDSLFVYATIRGPALLPCLNLVPSNCSDVSWTFFFKGDSVRYTVEVEKGKVKEDSEKSGRTSLLPNCSLALRDLRPADAGSYMCLQNDNATANVYLSILAITSPSTVTELQPGGNLSLNCVVYTYFDAGSCGSHSNVFSLTWTSGEGAELLADSRYKLQTSTNRCKITLMVTNLRPEDTGRKWRCSVSNVLNSQVTSLDFNTRFLFGDPSSDHRETASAACSLQLPISRIVLCAALPVMVMVVGFFTRRGERKRRAGASAAGIELQETT
ncbi:uncharacterized protein LOC141797403 [Halichoeres trimaculatus]|uniref:uncharacterized protein LOC141797403 n=1 Tax=Halichoeres trimaculatus TaxID=147232 RepID=UPI003D9EB3AF